MAMDVDLDNGPPVVNGSEVHFPTDILEYFSELDAMPNLRVWTHGGVLTRVFAEENKGSKTYKALHDMGFRLPTAFGCIVRYLIRSVPWSTRGIHQWCTAAA